MLIINNGVPKSGSTWIQKIIRKGLNPEIPSAEWRNKNHAPSIKPVKLGEYVASGEWARATTFVKMHFAYDERFAFLNDHKDIKIVVSYRNLPDSVISYFHHESRKDMLNGKSKEEWLADDGRRFAERALKHRMSWIDHPQAYLLRFEDMIEDIGGQIAGLMAFLDVPMDQDACNALGEKTQVRLKDAEKPRDGDFVRTAGRSVAKEEIPSELYEEFAEMENSARTAAVS